MIPPPNSWQRPIGAPILPPSQPIVIQTSPPRSSHLLTDILMFWLGWSMRKRFVEDQQLQAEAETATLQLRNTPESVQITSSAVPLRGSAIRIMREVLVVLFESDAPLQLDEMRSLKQLEALLNTAWSQAQQQLGFGAAGDDAELLLQEPVVRAMFQACELVLSAGVRLSQSEAGKVRILRDLLAISVTPSKKGSY